MAIFNNISPDSSSIVSVEFSPASEGNTAFFHLKAGADAVAVKQWLSDIGQKIEAETHLGKQILLVTHGDAKQDAILSLLKTRGGAMEIPETKKKINLWKLRGWASMIGQPLQLFSGYLSKGPPDVSTMGFAALNITANASNIVFGQQDEKDIHHLHKVKKGINATLEPYFAEGTDALAINDQRAKLRKKEEKISLGGRIYDFAKRNSVTVGEIGLRYLAAIALVLPIKKAVPGGDPKVLTYAHWKKGSGELAEGEFKTAFNTLKNNDRATMLAGLLYIGGKSIALATRPEDPYNPKKPTALDTFRQKVSFRLSSVIETCAAAVIALDRLNLVKIKDSKGTWKPRTIEYDKLIGVFKGHAPDFLKQKAGQFTKRDWLGGIGGLLFTGGLIIRIFAPFGVKKVDMDEVEAHASDSLAMVPPEKLRQAVADTAAYLTHHFRGNKVEFGQVYADLTKDLKEFHHISLPAGTANTAIAETRASEPAEAATAFAKPEMRKSGITSLPRPGSFQDLAVASEGVARGISA